MEGEKDGIYNACTDEQNLATYIQCRVHVHSVPPWASRLLPVPLSQ